MSYSNNASISSGGTAQDVVAEGHNFLAITIENDSDTAARVRVDATASSSTGDNLPAGTSQTFYNLCGRRLSIFGATTGKAFSWREASR